MNPTDLAELIMQIEAEEKRLVLPHLDNDDAWRLGTTLTDLARANHAPVTVDIRRNGQQLFHCALPGTSADNDAWILRKSRVVDRFGHSSYLVGLRCLARGTTFDLDPATYAAHGGAFPLTLAGTGVIGTVAVSGLPQAEDHRLVVAALERHLTA